MGADENKVVNEQGDTNEQDFVFYVSQLCERDSRRYNRPFGEQQEVSAK